MLTKNLGDVFEQSRNEQTFKLEMTNLTWNISHVTSAILQKLRFTLLLKVV